MAAAYYDYPGVVAWRSESSRTKETATTYMVKSILKKCRLKSGSDRNHQETIIGDTVIHLQILHKESLLVQKYLRQMLDEGCDCAVMESILPGTDASSNRRIHL